MGLALQEKMFYAISADVCLAHQGREAAVEFQKTLDHSGIVLNEPIGALAQPLWKQVNQTVAAKSGGR